MCNTRRHRNPTDVQHVYVLPATLTLQFMRALTARRALPAPYNRPSVLPRLTGSLNTTANSPTRLNVYKFSHRGRPSPIVSPSWSTSNFPRGEGAIYIHAIRAFSVKSMSTCERFMDSSGHRCSKCGSIGSQIEQIQSLFRFRFTRELKN